MRINIKKKNCLCDSLKEKTVVNSEVSNWCLCNAARCIASQAMDEAMQWNALAAHLLSFDCAMLTSPDLERQLLQIGNWLKAPVKKAFFSQDRPKRWLHVLTMVSSFGGHSSMLRNWIQLDPIQNNHSVVVLEQKGPVPEAIADAAKASGGNVIRMELKDSLLSRASQLREIVWTQADVVVLHIHPWDVIATVALALPGGPPVLLVNHAAHQFWVGASVTDMILNCRCSSQEDEWAEKCRGINEIMHLPIPIFERIATARHDSIFRDASRKSLHLPKDAIAILTIGMGYKYKPVTNIDFFKAVSTVLRRCKNAYLIAVGPNPDEHWISLSKEVEGRLLLVEKQPQLEMSTYFAAADLYLEGFPFGSTTALLEACLAGIPSVLPPKECPPPFISDGIALQYLEQPATVSDYVKLVQRLLEDGQERIRLGELLANSIKAHHCGANWADYLAKIQKNLPQVHRVRSVDNIKNVSEKLSSYWAKFSSVVNGDPLTFICKQNLYPNLSIELDEYLTGKTGYEQDELCYILMNIGDYYFWNKNFRQARKYYKYAIKINNFLFQIWIKYVLSILGVPGIKLRESAAKLKMNYAGNFEK